MNLINHVHIPEGEGQTERENTKMLIKFDLKLHKNYFYKATNLLLYLL